VMRGGSGAAADLLTELVPLRERENANVLTSVISPVAAVAVCRCSPDHCAGRFCRHCCEPLLFCCCCCSCSSARSFPRVHSNHWWRRPLRVPIDAVEEERWRGNYP
jgi:hypothetical protein